MQDINQKPDYSVSLHLKKAWETQNFPASHDQSTGHGNSG